ncbi:MAG TPA: ribonuclease HII [Bacillota bacterium]|nr:ribonuclease HII [Bacillota bacterium]
MGQEHYHQKLENKPKKKVPKPSWDERLALEKDCWSRGYQRVAGLDEAGRGPLAGPVVAAVFLITPEFKLEGLNDSKQLTPLQREKFYHFLTSGAWEYGVGIVDSPEIDRINIYQASRQAMLKALKKLKKPPDFLLVDALLVPETTIDQQPVIHGDALSVAIAAASVIAKYTRDRIMIEYDNQYPEYGFAKHKGYPTREHYEALAKFGPSPIHRVSFRLTREPAATAETLDLFEDQ